jgi:hypothetical protein
MSNAVGRRCQQPAADPERPLAIIGETNVSATKNTTELTVGEWTWTDCGTDFEPALQL